MEPSSWRRIRPGGRKTPEPITEPMKRRKRSRWRRVRRREARRFVGGASVFVGMDTAILAAQECLWWCERSMRSLRGVRRTARNGCPTLGVQYSTCNASAEGAEVLAFYVLLGAWLRSFGYPRRIASG